MTPCDVFDAEVGDGDGAVGAGECHRRAAAATQRRHFALAGAAAMLALLLPIGAQAAERGAPAPGAATPADLELPAKTLFGQVRRPAALAPRPIGGFARGCLAGAVELAADGPGWQTMRPSRNRAWGHPNLVAFLERFAGAAPAATGWPGILIGDLSQPRGGPTPTGHASHQTGLDVDIWLTPMPTRTLTTEERERMGAPSVVAANWNDIEPTAWTAGHAALIRLAAKQPEVTRVFANAAIKKALCREAGSDRTAPDKASLDRAWLAKVRPWWGHDEHIHIRLHCPAGATDCTDQPAVGNGDGCGAELAWWFSAEARKPAPKPTKPTKPPRPITLADLPAACRDVLLAD